MAVVTRKMRKKAFLSIQFQFLTIQDQKPLNEGESGFPS